MRKIFDIWFWDSAIVWIESNLLCMLLLIWTFDQVIETHEWFPFNPSRCIRCRVWHCNICVLWFLHDVLWKIMFVLSPFSLPEVIRFDNSSISLLFSPLNSFNWLQMINKGEWWISSFQVIYMPLLCRYLVSKWLVLKRVYLDF